MYVAFANALVLSLYAYLGVGILLAVSIVPFALARIDSEAEHSGLAFRLVILPGAVALWPVLLKRLLKGGGAAPVQKDPHR